MGNYTQIQARGEGVPDALRGACRPRPICCLRLQGPARSSLHRPRLPQTPGGAARPGSGRLARAVQAIGFYPGLAWAWVVTLVEFVGGIFLVLGFATRIAAALIAIEMIIAGLRVNLPRGFYWHQGGLEVPLIFAVMAIVIALTGPGSPSVDRSIRWERGYEDRPVR